MGAKRVIPCLDIKDGSTVKGINFVDLKRIGDPVQMAQQYEAQGADELVFLDISATVEGRKTFVDLVKKLGQAVTVPFAVGGGITSVEDAQALIDAGASKVSVNSAAVLRPEVIDELVAAFGSKAVVAAIDARKQGDKWIVTTHGGGRDSDKELYQWAAEVEKRGAGEILFTSMDHDGMKIGFPCDVFAKLADTVSIPLIASGGAGSIADMVEVLTVGRADAALAASIFHYGEITVPELKEAMKKAGLEVAPATRE